MTIDPKANRRMTYVLEPDEQEDGNFIARATFPSSQRLPFVLVPSSTAQPAPERDPEDSYIDGWFV